ncbi:MAG: SRPBCC family protein [Actinomycetota bacterium]|nr:SRPBCC family protein [Actinomycetota bacterium]
MFKISRTIGIKAHVDEVFYFVTDPRNWTRFVPGLISVTEKSANLPMKDSTFSWEHSMMGIRVSGQARVIEYQQNSRFAMLMTGRFPVKEEYIFIGRPEGTELTVELEYGLPEPMAPEFGGLQMMEKISGLDAGNTLEKIRLMCEARVPAGAG